MSFVQRALGFTFTLGTGSFGNSGSNTITAPSGLWATAQIQKNGTPSMNRANIRIKGLSLSVMNQLSRIGVLPTAVRNNIVTVTAGDAGGNMPLAFAGYIKEAWPDFSNPTEAVLTIEAFTGLLAQMKPVPPLSFAGSTDVATIMGQLAQQMGYTLENNGVSVQLRNPYLPGTARSQALAAADAAGIYVVFDDDNGVMAILPKTAARGGAAPVISPAEEMVGYPTYVGPGQLALTTEYNSQIRFMGNVNVQNSQITGANGTWRVTSLYHDLSTEPDGPWFSHVEANNLFSAQGA
jgi:hypothetical protein